MKTPMQKLIDWMESYRDKPFGSISEQDVLNKAHELKEEERQMVIDAANLPSSVDMNRGEQYYNETYGDDKE